MSKKNKFVHEVDRLSDDHPNAIKHPCFQYENYFEYQDTKSNYHFDKFRSDDNHPSIYTNLSFRWKGNIMDEVLPYVREKSRNAHMNDVALAHTIAWMHKMEMGGLDHVGYKEIVKTDKHPTLTKIVNWFEYEGEVQPIIMEKNVGNYEPWHCDTNEGHPSGYEQKPLARIIIHLEDWQPGQFMTWGNKNISQWKAGDSISYDPSIPHATANASRYRRYSLRITGVPGKNTLDKMKKGGVVHID